MGGIFKALFGGGGGGGGGGGAKPAAAAPAAAPAGTAPGTSPDEFKKQQNAYYQSMLSGLGMASPTGELPTGVQENIDKQAAGLK